MPISSNDFFLFLFLLSVFGAWMFYCDYNNNYIIYSFVCPLTEERVSLRLICGNFASFFQWLVTNNFISDVDIQTEKHVNIK